MTRVDFYHLQKQTLEQVLPKLLEKAYSTGKNIKIKVGNEMRVEFINSHLWTFDDGAAVSADDAGAYERIFNIFDGNLETAVEQSRGLWKEFKAAGMETYYWQQEENGRWIQKA